MLKRIMAKVISRKERPANISACSSIWIRILSKQTILKSRNYLENLQNQDLKYHSAPDFSRVVKSPALFPLDVRNILPCMRYRRKNHKTQENKLSELCWSQWSFKVKKCPILFLFCLRSSRFPVQTTTRVAPKWVVKAFGLAFNSFSPCSKWSCPDTRPDLTQVESLLDWTVSPLAVQLLPAWKDGTCNKKASKNITDVVFEILKSDMLKQ